MPRTLLVHTRNIKSAGAAKMLAVKEPLETQDVWGFHVATKNGPPGRQPTRCIGW